MFSGPTNDAAFNAQGLAGVKAVEKAMGLETDHIEGVLPPNEGKAMRDYVSQGFDVVWAHSGLYFNSVLSLAPQFPDTTFVVIGGDVPNKPDNVWTVGLELEDSYYLVGALAGLMTETNAIGVVGGVELPVYVASATAFGQGAESVNPDVKFQKNFVGSFSDPTKAREAATALIERNADVLAHMLNTGGFGVFEAARGKPVKVIGKDNDQNQFLPEQVITSVELRIEQLMTTILTGIADGEPGRYVPVSLKSGLARLAPFHNLVPEDVQARLAKIEADLVAGKIEHATAANKKG